jgi:bis(5'-nucleosyl)-tetraphosphatase (symmetrical)
MSTYAIGDLQGCFVSLQALLKEIRFEHARDRLWFVGDLVNRGAGSLDCLRFVAGLGARATTVLGNHDLHLLAVAEGIAKVRANDTLDEILSAPDREELLLWLRTQKLLHMEDQYAMVHAGLYPAWNWARAAAVAAEVEAALRGPAYREFLATMYGDLPDQWRDDLTGAARLRCATNGFTRMRALKADGRVDLKFKGTRDEMPPGLQAWFTVPSARSQDYTVVAGHWSALGVHVTPDFIGLDAGCVWGRSLAALRLEDRQIFQVPCAETLTARGWD